jgi:hypothetical protein
VQPIPYVGSGQMCEWCQQMILKCAPKSRAQCNANPNAPVHLSSQSRPQYGQMSTKCCMMQVFCASLKAVCACSQTLRRIRVASPVKIVNCMLFSHERVVSNQCGLFFLFFFVTLLVTPAVCVCVCVRVELEDEISVICHKWFLNCSPITLLLAKPSSSLSQIRSVWPDVTSILFDASILQSSQGSVCLLMDSIADSWVRKPQARVHKPGSAVGMKLDASAFWFCFGHVLNRTSLAGFFLPAIDVFASVRFMKEIPPGEHPGARHDRCQKPPANLTYW